MRHGRMDPEVLDTFAQCGGQYKQYDIGNIGGSKYNRDMRFLISYCVIQGGPISYCRRNIFPI